jgi:hypothetical protein
MPNESKDSLSPNITRGPERHLHHAPLVIQSQKKGAPSQRFLWFLLSQLATLLLLALIPLHAQTTYTIAGTLVSATEGHPLSHARVSILDVNARHTIQSVITGDDGHFAFTQLHAGKYSLTGDKRGYLSAAYDEHENFSTAIVTGAGVDTEHLILRIVPLAQISGKVLDERGEPVRRARVTLWRDDHSTGIGRTQRFNQDQTDDQGYYEFAPIAPGTYFVSVSADPWYAIHTSTADPNSKPKDVDRSLDVVYPTTYYSGAIESDDATPILLRGGEHVEIDLHLLPVAALHVIFRTANNPEEFASPMLFKRTFDDLDLPERQSARRIAPGAYELVTAPGRYHLSLPGNGINNRAQASEVDITDDNQEIQLAPNALLASAAATIQIQGETSLPQPLYLTLRDAKGAMVSRQVVDENGTVAFEEIPAGRYTILAASANKPYSVLGVTPITGAGKPAGKMTPGHTLDVTAGATLSFSITLIGGSANVEGFVKHDSKPIAGAMVVLVPDHPASNRELFRRDQSDLDGSFLLQGVVPGSYTVLAIEDGWGLDWSQPAVISRFIPHGQRIAIPQSATTFRVPASIDSQIK